MPGRLTKPEDIFKVRANWIGPAMGGYPGLIVEGFLVRPESYKSYVLVSEVDPIEYQPSVKNHRPPFWEASKASPDKVLLIDAAEREKIYAFFSPQQHALCRGNGTICGEDHRGRSVIWNWVGQSADGFPGFQDEGGLFVLRRLERTSA